MVKIKWMGKFDGNLENLPHGEHKPGAVQFKEANDMKKLGLVLNLMAVPLMLIFYAIVFLRGNMQEIMDHFYTYWAGIVAALVCLVPHEFIHAICFRKEAYIYTNLKNGLLFVVGPEDMSKSRFVIMSLMPNLLFGFLPFILYLIFPQMGFLGILGATSIPMGIGDYYNVFNALTQMPRGARTYLYGFHSWWYFPENAEKND